MKKIHSILRKCKTLSRQLGRTSSSYTSTHTTTTTFRSKSITNKAAADYQQLVWTATDADDNRNIQDMNEPCETIFVGSSRRRYVISSKYLNHPLLNALIQKSNQENNGDHNLSVKCEVVLFDHLLWMLQNTDPNLTSDSLEELAELYVY